MDRRGVATLSKKLFHELEALLKERLREQADVDMVLATICEVLRFDPAVNRYTPRVLEQTRAYRRAMKEDSYKTT